MLKYQIKSIMLKFIVVYHSKSHSVEKLANEIAIGMKFQENINVSLISCEEAPQRMNDFNEAHGIVFGSPTYFGSMAASLKSFLEGTVDVWVNKKWKNKVAAAFTHSSSLSGDKLMTLNAMMVFAMQNGMIWVGQDLLPNEEYAIPDEWSDFGVSKMNVNVLGSWMGLMSQSNPRIGIEISKNDLLTARIFGRRIAMLTAKLQD